MNPTPTTDGTLPPVGEPCACVWDGNPNTILISPATMVDVAKLLRPLPLRIPRMGFAAPNAALRTHRTKQQRNWRPKTAQRQKHRVN